MRHKIPISIIEIEPGNYHPIVTCVFHDGTLGHWVIDTGASKSVFDKNRPEHFTLLSGETDELHSAGISEEPIKTPMGHLKPFSFASLTVENLKVALLDMGHINHLYARATDLEICGLLGGDFLMGHKAVIDYRKKRLVLR